MIKDLLRVYAAYSNVSGFIGFKLVTANKNKDKVSNTVLLFDEQSIGGFRVGDNFVPGMKEKVTYKKVELDFKSTILLEGKRPPYTHCQRKSYDR